MTSLSTRAAICDAAGGALSASQPARSAAQSGNIASRDVPDMARALLYAISRVSSSFGDALRSPTTMRDETDQAEPSEREPARLYCVARACFAPRELRRGLRAALCAGVKTTRVGKNAAILGRRKTRR